mmetsp:Transcript_31247/g.90669  ORF Transcript_31247/g.90669 Transcript_31247/m.90669 type:complete len:450 (+) Transcript_31247:2284-3633(+)
MGYMGGYTYWKRRALAPTHTRTRNGITNTNLTYPAATNCCSRSTKHHARGVCASSCIHERSIIQHAARRRTSHHTVGSSFCTKNSSMPRSKSFDKGSSFILERMANSLRDLLSRSGTTVLSSPFILSTDDTAPATLLSLPFTGSVRSTSPSPPNSTSAAAISGSTFVSSSFASSILSASTYSPVSLLMTFSASLSLFTTFSASASPTAPRASRSRPRSSCTDPVSVSSPCRISMTSSPSSMNDTPVALLRSVSSFPASLASSSASLSGVPLPAVLMCRSPSLNASRSLPREVVLPPCSSKSKMKSMMSPSRKSLSSASSSGKSKREPGPSLSRRDSRPVASSFAAGALSLAAGGGVTLAAWVSSSSAAGAGVTSLAWAAASPCWSGPCGRMRDSRKGEGMRNSEGAMSAPHASSKDETRASTSIMAFRGEEKEAHREGGDNEIRRTETA